MVRRETDSRVRPVNVSQSEYLSLPLQDLPSAECLQKGEDARGDQGEAWHTGFTDKQKLPSLSFLLPALFAVPFPQPVSW